MATSHEIPDPTDDLRPEYDFRKMRGVVRGKYASRYRERLRLVRLADDVAEAVMAVLRAPTRACPVEIVLEPQRNPERAR